MRVRVRVVPLHDLVDDRRSHDVGDQVLVQVAKILETEVAALSAEAFVVRMGGEEFLVVLPGFDGATATARLDGIRRTIRTYGWTEITHGLPVTVSIGIAGSEDLPTHNQAAFLAIADRNLYVAKHGGRDRVVAGPTGERRAPAA